MLCKLFVKAGFPFQIDGFSETSKRSVKDNGSLHFRPNTIVTVTEDEWEKIENDGLQDRFIVMEKSTKKPSKKRPAVKVETPVEKTVDETISEQTELEESIFEKKVRSKKKKKNQ